MATSAPIVIDARILAIETSGLAGSVAFHSIDCRKSMDLDPSQGSTKSLAPAIHELLASCNVSPKSLDAIAVGIGPGSFTGLRVGIATAKAMAFALRIPVLAIDTLEAISWNAMDNLNHPPFRKLSQGTLWTFLDAYRGEVFASEWHFTSSSSLESRRPSHLIAIDTWLSQFVASNDSTSISVLAGPGLKRIQPRLPESEAIVLLEEAIPHASTIADLGAIHWSLKKGLDPFQVLPNYLRRSAAEEKVGVGEFNV